MSKKHQVTPKTASDKTRKNHLQELPPASNTSEAANEEYKLMREEILQYMEEYQTVRNMMYAVTGVILGFSGKIWENDRWWQFCHAMLFIMIIGKMSCVPLCIFSYFWKNPQMRTRKEAAMYPAIVGKEDLENFRKNTTHQSDQDGKPSFFSMPSSSHTSYARAYACFFSY